MDENSNENLSENPNTYRKASVSKTSNGFGKNVLVPFISSIVGTTLVLGVCFGIPNIRQTILGDNLETASTSSNVETNKSYSKTDLTAVSLSNYSDTSISAAEKVLPSIVGITVEYSVSSQFSRNTSTASAQGSGIIISEDGYILTNNHIVNSSSSSSYYSVSEANKVTVNLYNDETTYEASIIGTDSQTDLAVIKIDKTGLTAATLGDSDSVMVGEFAMAVGNPLGLQSSVTSGIISALNREVKDSDGKTYTLIQTDAAINSGNSGGALVDSEGNVIGINTLKLSGTGIEGMGFAIPINSAKDISNQLIQYNKVKRPYIGISGIDINEQTATYYKLVVGVYVKSVNDFSAAQKSGLKAGDVITAIDGTSIKTMNELNEIKNKHQIGDEITLTINRNGNESSISLTLEEQP